MYDLAGVSQMKHLMLIRKMCSLIKIPFVNNDLSSSTKFLKYSFIAGLPSPHHMPMTKGRIC